MADKTMEDLLNNKSLLLQTSDLKAPVTRKVTELVSNKVRQEGSSLGDVRKCQSEYKMKKYDYLGDREHLYAGKNYENCRNGVVLR